MPSALLEAAGMLMDPAVLIAIVLGASYGLFMGAMPGLTATMAMALMIPFVIFVPTAPALAAIIAMHSTAILAGDFPGALLRIPGTPASAAYVEDSYAITQRGHGYEALGIHTLGACLGGLAGVVALVMAAPLLAEGALHFTTFEYFWLAILGLSAAIAISQGSMLKGLIATCIGLLLATVGLDVTMGYPRFTFGNEGLMSGIHLVPAMIGLFGLSQVMRTVAEGPTTVGDVPDVALNDRSFRPIRRAFRMHWRHGVRGAGIGTVVGALPGAGPDIAAYVTYAATKGSSKTPQEFGTGSREALVACSISNNASLASAWVPTLVLGIPGDAGTAMLIGVLLMHGLQPGPQLFTQQASLMYTIFILFFLASLLLLPIGYIAMRIGTRLLAVPKDVLMPLIVLSCTIGAFAVNNSLFDVGVMVGMGLLGFVMERRGMSVAPVLLALILGPIIEQNFMASVMKTNWGLLEFVSRPVSIVLVVLTIVALSAPNLRKLWRSSRRVDQQV